MFRIALVVLLGMGATAQLQHSETGKDFGRVREILREYYTRAARQYGRDYDPDTVVSDNVRQPCVGNNEQCANRKIWGDLFENDIVLTLPQAERLLDESSRRGKRQAQPTPDSFWRTLTVPYGFGFVDSTWSGLIRRALRHVESETCIRFAENGGGTDRLTYIRGSGCWSNVGRIGGTQQVSIGYGCDSLGIIAHETLHALGLWHEQSRVDRDNYVFINPSAIIRGTEGNFQKRTPSTSDNMGQPYDLGSVMHYGPKSFTTNYNIATIQARDSRYQRTMGQRDGVSFKDAKMINLRYCDKICPRKLNCQNEGYTDPNNCNKCKCPSGYGGTYCEQVQRTSCGGELRASFAYQKLDSGDVRSNSNCIWRIKSPAGQKLELNFERVNFICRETCSSYVEVKYTNNKAISGARLCCDDQKTNILAEADEAIIIFKGEENLPSGYQGFLLNYRYYGGASPTAPTPTAPTTTTTMPAPTTTTRPYWWTTTTPRTTTRRTTRCSRGCSPSSSYISSERRRSTRRARTTIAPKTRTRSRTTARFEAAKRIRLAKLKKRTRENKKRRLAKKMRSWDVQTEVESSTTSMEKTEEEDEYSDEDEEQSTATSDAKESLENNETESETDLLTTEGSGLEVDPLYAEETTTTSYGIWSLWSEWSRCSEPCGGCGRRRRIRACFGAAGEGTCPGVNSEEQPCNTQVCVGGKKGHICNGRVLIPCDLANKLHFGASQQDSPVAMRLPIPRDTARNAYNNPYPSQRRMARSKRDARNNSREARSVFADAYLSGSQQQSGQLCEKRFTFYCPSRLLTISIDWLRTADQYPEHNDSPQCCTGYYASGGTCYKNQ